MGVHVVRRFCPDCGQKRPFEKQKMNWLLHLFLTIFTAGLWLIVIIILLITSALTPYRCRDCGKAKY